MIKIDDNIIDRNNDKNSTCQIIFKSLVKNRGITLKTAAELWNEHYNDDCTTPQSLSNKLSRNTLQLSEFLKYTDLLGYNISFELIDKPKTASSPQVVNDTVSEDRPITVKSPKADSKKPYKQLLSEGYADYESVNFDIVVIAGKNAYEAANWIKSNLHDEMDENDEILLMIAANKKFDVICKPIIQGGAT